MIVHAPDSRSELLRDLHRQLASPHLSDRARARTLRAVERLEAELAPGRAREREVLNR